jgi:hypothetical protein
MPFIAWYAVFRLFDVARRVVRYTNVQTGPPEVAIRLRLIPGLVRVCSQNTRWILRALQLRMLGISSPTPRPAIPRAMMRNQSIFFAGETWKTRVESREPRTTRLDVISIPLFRENRSEAYPSMRMPAIDPMRRALERRVWNVAVYTFVPKRWFITMLVLDAWASQQTGTHSQCEVSYNLSKIYW